MRIAWCFVSALLVGCSCDKRLHLDELIAQPATTLRLSSVPMASEEWSVATLLVARKGKRCPKLSSSLKVTIDGIRADVERGGARRS